MIKDFQMAIENNQIIDNVLDKRQKEKEVNSVVPNKNTA